MSIIVNAIRDAGARGDGSDDSVVLQNALDKIELERGGTLLLEEPPVEYRVTKTLNIPKVKISIIGRGIHTAIVGRGLAPAEPVLAWKNVSGHVDHSFFLRDLMIRRNNSGPVVQYIPVRRDERWKGRISNIWLQQPNDGTGTLLRLERVLNCHIEGLILGGGSSGGVGLHLKEGSNALVTQVVVMAKRRAPNGILIEGGGEHHFTKVRCEGAGGSFSYKFVGVKGSVFESLKSEGENERTVFHVKDCEDLIFFAPGIGTPASGIDPDGMVFENSKRCSVYNARSGAMQKVGSGQGFVFDGDCEDIFVNAFFKRGNAINEVDDRGGDNISYDLQDADGRRITSQGKRRTSRV